MDPHPDPGAPPIPLTAADAASAAVRFGSIVAGAVALSVVLRARFLTTPLTADEGGALVVARVWARGGDPYLDAWVDRPQGVLLLYRWWDALGIAEPGASRVLAMVAGAGLVVGVAWIARFAAGATAGATAAVIAAVVSTAPSIEGFIVNGELLVAGFSAPALAIVVGVARDRLPVWSLLGAGVLAGAAMSMKQSGYDAAATAVIWIVGMVVARRMTVRRAVALATPIGLGVALVVVPLLIHGATIDWDEYRYAMWGFRLDSRSALRNAEWISLVGSTISALPVIVPLGVVIGLGVRARRRTGSLRPTSIEWLLLVWLAVNLQTFAAGGQFHRHYWVTLTAPLAVIAGIALESLVRRRDEPPARARARLLGATAAVPLAAAVVFIVAPGLERDPRLDTNVDLAAWWDVAAADAEPGTSSLYALCASAGLYTETGELPGYRYLWADHVAEARGAAHELAEFLGGPDGPEFVAVFQPPDECDPSGAVEASFTAAYEPVTTVGDVTVHRRTP